MVQSLVGVLAVKGVREAVLAEGVVLAAVILERVVIQEVGVIRDLEGLMVVVQGVEEGTLVGVAGLEGLRVM